MEALFWFIFSETWSWDSACSAGSSHRHLLVTKMMNSMYSQSVVLVTHSNSVANYSNVAAGMLGAWKGSAVLLQTRTGSSESPMEILLSYIGYPYLAEDLEVEKLQAVAAIAQAVACHPSLLRNPFVSFFPLATGELGSEVALHDAACVWPCLADIHGKLKAA